MSDLHGETNTFYGQLCPGHYLTRLCQRLVCQKHFELFQSIDLVLYNMLGCEVSLLIHSSHSFTHLCTEDVHMHTQTHTVLHASMYSGS